MSNACTLDFSAKKPKETGYTDELAEHIKIVYRHVSRIFAKKFEEERSLWERLFKAY